MNKLKPYQVFEDDRGKLIGIMNDAQWEEFNYLETKAGNVRGNHYHEHTRGCRGNERETRQDR